MESFPPRRVLQTLVLKLLPGCASLKCQYPPRPISGSDSKPDPSIQHWPRISVVVPSYNQGQFLAATLDSLVLQNYPQLEIILIDGESTDDTHHIIEKYKGILSYWISEADTGQANAINKGMLHAEGDILAWLNSDDCLMPGALFRVAETFLAEPSTDVVYGHRVLIDEQGRDVGRWVIPGHRKFILNDVDFIPQETMFWRAELWQRVDAALDESFQFALDWDLICRFVDVDARFRLLPYYLGQFRLHKLQKSQSSIESQGFKEMSRIRERYRRRVASGWLPQKIFFYRRRWSIYSFLLRARLKELFIVWKLLKIR